MNEIDYSIFNEEAYDLIKKIANCTDNESHEISLSYEEDDDWKETINVAHISYVDYYYLKKAFENISKEDRLENEVMDIYYEMYSPSTISSVKLEIVGAGPFISGNHGVSNNCYSSDCDTYGPYYYSAYFLYQAELEEYIVIVEKNYAT